MEVLAAIWRFATDQCEGGRKATAFAQKAALVILFAGVTGGLWAAPIAYEAVEDFRGTMTGFRESLNEMSRVLAIQGASYSAKDQVQDYRIGQMETDVNVLERDMADAQREIGSLKGDVRHLNDTTVKVGR